MIKVGIIGTSNPMAGELIRLLINHPDVAIVWVDSARFTGRLVSDVHHGLLGETELRISPSSLNLLDDINALFIFRHKGQTIEWLEQNPLPEELRVVDLSVDMRDAATAERYGFVYGMPELNRKALVRGAQKCVVPHPVANIALLSLLPLAKRHELNTEVRIEALSPLASEPVAEEREVISEITAALRVLQPGFGSAIELIAGASDFERAMSATVEFDSSLDLGEIIRTYEEFYDDHNFTFIINQQPEPKEVEGTNKCIIYIDKHGSRVTVRAMMDAIVKGASGTAVHDMNLLFGLHERVGLALKASNY